jgi:voltage-dependent calcium channel L type alpha-1D
MKKLVTSLLKSIPELLTVVAFLSFLFFLYGVIGVQLWSGVLHARCRLTPHPVKLDPALVYQGFHDYQIKVLNNVSMFACSDHSGVQIPIASDEWSQDSSPWKSPRVCYWPIADEDEPQTCAIDSDFYRQCPRGQTCGSDFDAFGNFRFTHPDKEIFRNVINAASYNANMAWGYVSFDNIGFAALAIFQCITREGW